jgi:hypothetical protein
MARKLIVEVVGETAGLSRAFSKASSDATSFQGKIEHTFRNVGRNIAFGVTALVGAGGLSEAFTTTIKAAQDAAVAQKSLAAQMKTSGESFQQNKARIDAAEQSMAKYGFTSEDSARGLTTLDRATGNITKAFQLQGVAANVARARNLTLSQAALILGKAYDGNTTSLKRLGIELPKGTKGMQAIYLVAQKFAGQAAANTTAYEKFSTTLHDTEVIIGTALLPTVNKYLDAAAKWLDNLNRSGKLQQDVNTAMKDAVAAFQAVKDIVTPLVQAFKDLGDAVGGTKNEVKLLIAAFAAFKTASFLESIGLVSAGVGRIGTNAETSAGKVTGLRSSLGRLAGTTFVVPIALEIRTVLDKSSTFQRIKKGLGPAGFILSGPGDIYNILKTAIGNVTSYIGGSGANAPGGLQGSLFAGKTLVRPGAPGGTLGLPTGVSGSGGVNTPLNAYQRLQVSLAADPNNISLLQQQAARDRSAIAFAQKLKGRGVLEGQKFVDTVGKYYNDLTSTLGQIQSIQDAAAALTKAARDKAAAAAKKRVQDALAFAKKEKAIEDAEDKAVRDQNARIAKRAADVLAAARKRHARDVIELPGFRLGPITRVQAGTIGIQQFTEPIGLQLAEARAGALGQPLRPILVKMRAAARAALKAGNLSIQAQIEAWNEITSINQQLTKSAKGFTNDIAQAKPYSLTRGGGVVINGGVHLHGVQDMTQLENQLEARAKARPKVRRGAR